MANFKISFFKQERDTDNKTGKTTTTGNDYVGSVTLSDINVDDNTSLIALAFRQATPGMQLCNKVVVEKI